MIKIFENTDKKSSIYLVFMFLPKFLPTSEVCFENHIFLNVGLDRQYSYGAVPLSCYSLPPEYLERFRWFVYEWPPRFHTRYDETYDLTDIFHCSNESFLYKVNILWLIWVISDWDKNLGGYPDLYPDVSAYLKIWLRQTRLKKYDLSWQHWNYCWKCW